MRVLALLYVACAACSSHAASPDAASPDAMVDPADAGADAGKDEACAATFGDALTNAFGRVDGTVTAVVQPGDARCAQINGDHVVVQVSMNGAIYRMVVNVLSDSGDPVLMRTLDAPLPAPGFAEGWHPGLGLDYATDLMVHSTDAAWQPHTMAEATALVGDAIQIGAPIAVYATSTGGVNASGAHLVHRHAHDDDGALVIDPSSAQPHWLLFHFSNQAF